MTTTDDSNPGQLHDWKIDPKQYERHESRRGRRHAYTSLDPIKTALVVVDVIPFFVNENPYCKGIVPNISRLADELRTAGGTVAWVLPAKQTELSEVSKEFLGAEIAKMFNESSGEGPMRQRLWHEFDVHDDDLMVEKSCASAFFPGRCEPDLHQLLQSRDIENVLITGTVTNVCCEGTARDASALGYRVVMVADANATVNDAMHNATLCTIYRTFGDVRPSDEVLQLFSAE